MSLPPMAHRLVALATAGALLVAVVAEGDKALDFRIEEAKPEGAAPAAPAEPAPAGNVVQVEFGQAPQQ